MANTISGVSNFIQPANVQAVDQAADAPAPAQRPVNSQAAAASESDRMDLSGAGQILGDALRTVGSLSSFHPELVKELKTKIASGSYYPDPSAVAQAVAKALGQES